MPSVNVNGTELYYEIRGAGPPVLLIMGGTGDGAILTRSPTCWLTSSQS
jgi:pimeloyl-ACP methyl ester carboxylesterase